MVKEMSVVAAKLDYTNCPLPSFRLPLRTKIELHFYGRWKESQVSPSISRYDFMAEEVSKPVYHEVTGHVVVYYLDIYLAIFYYLLFSPAVARSSRPARLCVLLLFLIFERSFSDELSQNLPGRSSPSL